MPWIAKYDLYFCHMMVRAEMGCFKMSPLKPLTLPPSTTLQVSSSPSVLQALHQFRTAVTALEQSQTMLVKFEFLWQYMYYKLTNFYFLWLMLGY